MKVVYLAIILYLLSCKTKVDTPEHSPKALFEFELIDGLGSVSLLFPDRVDTFFTWIHKSDCGKGCQKGKYRFQSKTNKVYKESGFYWTGEPEDSVDQLTIYHSRPDSIISHRGSLVSLNRAQILSNLLTDSETGNVISDTLMNIGGRQFYVCQIADWNNKTLVRSRRLIAYTMISGWDLIFEYKLLTKKYDSILTNYFQSSLDHLATVRLKEGG